MYLACRLFAFIFWKKTRFDTTHPVSGINCLANGRRGAFVAILWGGTLACSNARPSEAFSSRGLAVVFSSSTLLLGARVLNTYSSAKCNKIFRPGAFAPESRCRDPLLLRNATKVGRNCLSVVSAVHNTRGGAATEQQVRSFAAVNLFTIHVSALMVAAPEHRKNKRTGEP